VRRFIFILPFFAIACSSSKSPTEPSSKTIGPEGGTIDVTLEEDSELGGTELVIPPGALTVPTTITISHGAEIAQNSESSRGPSVRLSPDGTMLAVPATLRLPQTIALQNDPGGLYFAVQSGGTHAELPVIGTDGKGSRANIAHFSDYELVSVVSGGECEAATTAQPTNPQPGDENMNYFCYKNYACTVCKDSTCGDDIGAGDVGGGCGGEFPILGDCMIGDWNSASDLPPLLPGCIDEAPMDCVLGDRRMCCKTSATPMPAAPQFEPADACENACGAQGASDLGVQVTCTSTVSSGSGCSGSATLRWSGQDSTTCNWYVGGGLVADGLVDGTGSEASLALSGFPVGTQPPLPVSLGQGQTCPNQNPPLGTSVTVQDGPAIPVALTCTDAGTSMKTSVTVSLQDCQAWLCTECQTHTKDFFVSELGGGLFGEVTLQPDIATTAGDLFPPVSCQVTGAFGLGGCMGGVCK
jgi:hypothetical protein